MEAEAVFYKNVKLFVLRYKNSFVLGYTNLGL